MIIFLTNVYLLIMILTEPSRWGPRRWVSDGASSCVSAPSRGSYRFERPNGTFFDVRIPPFSLESKKDDMPNGFLSGPFWLKSSEPRALPWCARPNPCQAQSVLLSCIFLSRYLTAPVCTNPCINDWNNNIYNNCDDSICFF